jgi:hypothetical protein
MTVATYGGLLWAGVVKVALRYGWRRLTAPKASHRGARQLTRLRPTVTTERSLAIASGEGGQMTLATSPMRSPQARSVRAVTD